MPTTAEAEATLEVATLADLSIIGRLAHATGFFGSPADTFFPSSSLFAELWVAPYLVAGHARVARSGEAVVGYCLGVDRPTEYLRGLRVRAPHVLRAFLRERGRTRALRFALRAMLTPRLTAPKHRYPAHLHLAVAADARGSGLGRRLLRGYLEAARGRGVRGLQLSTTDLHAAAMCLYRSEGFDTWGTHESRLWQPWIGRPLRHRVMTLDLARWDPSQGATPEATAPG